MLRAAHTIHAHQDQIGWNNAVPPVQTVAPGSRIAIDRPDTSVVAPRRVGGNLDIRDLTAGTALYLPVEVNAGLFSIDNSHAAQAMARSAAPLPRARWR